ncbi:SIR2 family protein [Clostridium beijerinckii]|uniref:SIR2 family protein n=1 Tax=Clostridium beijerinckii TaxID=1520 RepID=UPI00047DCB34|nr:SIR2 family protein [Clostridium beijerinckii]
MINFINESKRIIKKASENNKLVLFVGSGVSANSGYPSWISLVEEFAKGIGIDTKNISSEDYLKIPQYYYNSRKEKDYYDVIFNKFNIKVKPNSIHDLVFELNPYHVVTTNYDELLEDAADSKGMFYDVVSKDKDLPYTPNGKMIIKMHGDLKNKNIVLKEDDYLSYFKNYKLIQNYIKSLISTHTILFIGYSINDINVKYIFQWVKDILGNDFQQAYFLDTDENKKFNQMEFEYYKNRGINILYYSQIKDLKFLKNNVQPSNLTNEKGKNTYKFLKYLLDENDKSIINIDYFYDKLINLNNLNKIRFKDITTALNLETPFEEDGKIIFSHFNVKGNELELYTSVVKDLFGEIKEYEDKINEIENCSDDNDREKIKKEVDYSKKAKIELVKQVFFKAGIRKIIERDKERKVIVLVELNKEENNEFVENYILKFDYYNLQRHLDNMSLNNEESNEIHLEKAYILYKLGEYFQAYVTLKKLSESCFRNKKYYLYFISEINRYYLGHLLAYVNPFALGKLGIDMNTQKIIRKEINKIDLNDIYLKLPSNSRSSLIFLRDISNFKFIFSKIKDTIDMKEEVEKDKDTIYSGYLNEGGKIYEFNNDIKDFWNYINKNKIMLDNYNEIEKVFYNYIEGALLSHMIVYKEKKETFWGIPGKVIKLEEIDYFTVFLMLVYLNKKTIKYLFEKYEVEKIKLEEGALESLKEAYNNIIASILREKNIITIKEIFKNYLYILSRIDVGKELFSEIIDGFLEVIHKYSNNELRELYDNLEVFVINQNNNYKLNLCNEKIEEVLNYILEKPFVEKENSYYRECAIVSYMEVLSIVINNSDEKYILKNDNMIKLLIRQVEVDHNFSSIESILIELYKLLNDEMKNNIKLSITEKLNSASNFQYNSFNLYYKAVINNVVKNNVQLEEKLLKYIEDYLEKEREENVKGIYSESFDISPLVKIAILMLNAHIIDIDKFKKFKDQCEEFSFLVDMDGYNYDNFELEWILRYNDKMHTTISSCDKAQSVIKEKLKNEILKNDCDKKLIETFFKYYD